MSFEIKHSAALQFGKTNAAAQFGNTNTHFHLGFGGSSDTTSFGLWGTPYLIETREVGESIEMIYKQVSNMSITIYPPPPPQVRVFKIVYSCKDGKWHKSEPIFGRIVPPTEEQYDFDNQ